MFKAYPFLLICRIRQRNRYRSGSTEPANYRGSYTTARKEIVDIEIAMHQNSRTLLIDTIARTAIVTTAIQQMLWLLKLTLSREQEGGLRN
jgi:hypothetical protein